jgi:hypothetical protein
MEYCVEDDICLDEMPVHFIWVRKMRGLEFELPYLNSRPFQVEGWSYFCIFMNLRYYKKNKGNFK